MEKAFDLLKNFFHLLILFLQEVLGEDLGKYDDAIADVTLPE